MTDTKLVDRYSSLPSEQRQKILAELAHKSVKSAKHIPVYLQIELSKAPLRRLPLRA